MVTPLKYPAWQARLKFCDDPKAEWVLDGIKNGFRVGYTGDQLISTFETCLLLVLMVMSWSNIWLRS